MKAVVPPHQVQQRPQDTKEERQQRLINRQRLAQQGLLNRIGMRVQATKAIPLRSFLQTKYAPTSSSAISGQPVPGAQVDAGQLGGGAVQSIYSPQPVLSPLVVNKIYTQSEQQQHLETQGPAARLPTNYARKGEQAPSIRPWPCELVEVEEGEQLAKTAAEPLGLAQDLDLVAAVTGHGQVLAGAAPVLPGTQTYFLRQPAGQRAAMSQTGYNSFQAATGKSLGPAGHGQLAPTSFPHIGNSTTPSRTQQAGAGHGGKGGGAQYYSH